MKVKKYWHTHFSPTGQRMLEDRFVVPKPIVGCLQNENIDTLESEVDKKKKTETDLREV